jgi:hypothetical protein
VESTSFVTVCCGATNGTNSFGMELGCEEKIEPPARFAEDRVLSSSIIISPYCSSIKDNLPSILDSIAS